jgi:hypothetical protein
MIPTADMPSPVIQHHRFEHHRAGLWVCRYCPSVIRGDVNAWWSQARLFTIDGGTLKHHEPFVLHGPAPLFSGQATCSNGEFITESARSIYCCVFDHENTSLSIVQTTFGEPAPPTPPQGDRQ